MRVANVITYGQAELLCSIINRLSSGGHPEANSSTLKFFNLSYVAKLAKKARPMLKPHAQLELDAAISALSRAEH